MTAYLSGILTLSPDEMAEVCLVEFMTYKQKQWTVKCTWQFSSTHISISSGPLLWSAFEPSPLGSTQFSPQKSLKVKKKPNKQKKLLCIKRFQFFFYPGSVCTLNLTLILVTKGARLVSNSRILIEYQTYGQVRQLAGTDTVKDCYRY